MAALETLAKDADSGRLIESFTERVRMAHAPRQAPFRMDVLLVDLETTLIPPPPGSYQLHEEAGKTLLEFNGVRYQIAAAVAETLRALTSGSSFRTSSLRSPMDAASRLALMQHLHDIGFLKLAPP